MPQDVWDPEVVFTEKHTGAQNLDVPWVSAGYELPVDEAIEIFRLEFIPPVNVATNLIRAMQIEMLINSKPVEGIVMDAFMAPAKTPVNPAWALNFGVPYLWKPITGIIPGAIDATCPKATPGQLVQIKVTPKENITEDYSVTIKFARVRTAAKLAQIAGIPSVTPSFSLDNESFAKAAIPVTLENWDVLPGGLRQEKPQIFPWWVYSRNKAGTTPNKYYDFTYPLYVNDQFEVLDWNLVTKTEAYIVRYLGAHPDANSLYTRFYTEGRITNPDFPTRPLPEINFFTPATYQDLSVMADLKWAGPIALPKPVLFHGVKGGIQILDNGTAIAANNMRLNVYGTKFVLK